MAVAEGLEPSRAGLTIRCLTSLATPQKNWMRRRESNSHQLVYKTSALEPVELRRNLVDREGFKPSQEVCRTSMLSLHHQPVLSAEREPQLVISESVFPMYVAHALRQLLERNAD
jgi:hypothetical protein